MTIEQRLRDLAERRQRLLQRSEQQRETLGAQWQAASAPLQRAGGVIERWRQRLAPVATLALPLAWWLLRRRPALWRATRLVMTVWPLWRSARVLRAK